MDQNQDKVYEFLDEHGLNVLTEYIFDKVEMYYVLKSKYNEDISRLESLIESLTGRVASLETEITSLKELVKTLTPSEDASGETPTDPEDGGGEVTPPEGGDDAGDNGE